VLELSYEVLELLADGGLTIATYSAELGSRSAARSHEKNGRPAREGDAPGSYMSDILEDPKILRALVFFDVST
jgi:hypothetical protein